MTTLSPYGILIDAQTRVSLRPATLAEYLSAELASLREENAALKARLRDLES